MRPTRSDTGLANLAGCGRCPNADRAESYGLRLCCTPFGGRSPLSPLLPVTAKGWTHWSPRGAESLHIAASQRRSAISDLSSRPRLPSGFAACFCRRRRGTPGLHSPSNANGRRPELRAAAPVGPPPRSRRRDLGRLCKFAAGEPATLPRSPAPDQAVAQLSFDVRGRREAFHNDGFASKPNRRCRLSSAARTQRRCGGVRCEAECRCSP